MSSTPNKALPIIFLITVCIYVPLFESWYAGTLWGLNWESPIFMDQLGDRLRVLKLILVFGAFILLLLKEKVVREAIHSVLIKNIYIAAGYLLACLQLFLLSLGVLFIGDSPSNLDYFHKTISFNNQSIYINTVDPGAMGRVYIYVYLECRLPFNRYQLKPIVKIGYGGRYSFDEPTRSLVLTDIHGKSKTHNIDMTTFKCSQNE